MGTIYERALLAHRLVHDEITLDVGEVARMEIVGCPLIDTNETTSIGTKKGRSLCPVN